MRGEVVHHHPDHLSLRIVHIDQVAHIFGEVASRAVIGDLDVAPRTVRIDTDKQVYGTIAAIFVIVATRLRWRRRDRFADFADQMRRALVVMPRAA